MVHIKSKTFKKASSEIASYWFGYLRNRAYKFSDRARIRCRTPIQDIGHLYKLTKDLGLVKIPTKINGSYGRYAQLILDNKELCQILDDYGWNSIPSKELNSRHVLRGLLDGGGSISRNGRGKQAKYLRVAFYSKDIKLLQWIMAHLGERKVSRNHISWTGKRAIEIVKALYLNQSRYLDRKLSLLSDDIF